MRLSRPPQHQRGIALILVLWLLALLTLMAAAYAASTRTEIRMTTVTLEQTRARALAEAGLWRGVQVLTQVGPDTSWHTDGRANRFMFDDHIIEVRIMDEAGKLDLNTGRAELFMGILAHAGVEPARRQALVDAILDWRDPDSLRHLHGAEDDDYRQLDLAYGAKDGPFNSVSELQYVAGMDTALFERIAPILTIYSHQPGINPELASDQVLSSLPGAAPGDQQSLTAQGVTATAAGVHPSFLSTTRGQAYTVVSTARTGSISFSVSAVIAPRAGDDTPYAIVAWQPAVADR